MSITESTARVERLHAGLGALRETPLGRALESTWLWGIAVGLVSWPSAAVAPTIGLDPSWHLGLHMAVEDALDFGTDVAFTYGPLGILDFPLVAEPGQAALSLLYLATVQLGAGLTLVYAARRSFPLAVAVPIAFLTQALTIRLAVPIAIVWCLVAVADDSPRAVRRALPFAGGAASAVLALEKLNIGLLVIALCAVAVVFMEDGGRQRLRNGLAFVGTFVVSLGVLWVALRQDLSALGDFVGASADVVSAYSSSLVLESTSDPATHAIVALAVAAAALAAALLAGRRITGPRRVGLMLLAAIALFALWKTTIVRHDAPRDAYVTAGGLAVILAFRWRGEERIYALAGVVAIIVLTFVMTGHTLAGKVRPVAAVDGMVDQARAVLDPDRRGPVSELSRAGMRASYAVDEKTLRLIRGKTVHVHPWEAGLAWAYGLDWDPLPVFQSYAAYAPGLDDLNAERVASPDGPERILVHTRTYPGKVGAEAFAELTRDELQQRNAASIDGRFLSYDQPATTLAILCNFEALRTTRAYQVLGRVPDRCGEPRSIESVTVANGEAATVPRPRRDEAVFARVHGLEPSGLERLRTFAFRATNRHATFDSERRYRIVPGVASQGLIMRAAPGIDFPRPFATSPDARSVSFSQDAAFLSSASDIEIEFLAMPVRPTERSGAG